MNILSALMITKLGIGIIRKHNLIMYISLVSKKMSQKKGKLDRVGRFHNRPSTD